MEARKPHIVYIVVGPTASGKSDVAVELALRKNGEVISADSVQVYRGLNIGSGKITPAETKGVPHHLIDVVDPGDYFSAEDFRTLGNQALEKIIDRDCIPIIAGGTGFYIDTLVHNLKYPQIDPEIKQRLQSIDTKSLYPEAREVLPVKVWESFDNQNPVRVRNRLGLWLTHGDLPKPEKLPRGVDIDFIWLGINPGLEQLKSNITARTESRLDKGLAVEVESLLDSGVSPDWLQSVGLTYETVVEYLQTNTPIEEFKNHLIKAELEYTKRQLTWFKKNQKIKWFENCEDLLSALK